VSAPVVLPSASPDDGKAPLAVGDTWSTGFEDGFCGYSDVRGYCYSGAGSFRLVTHPTRAGHFAGAFGLVKADGGDSQARCSRRGVFPSEAYYGAWFYIPRGIKNRGNWNLMHFQGSTGDEELHGLWDVSLDAKDDGSIQPHIYGFLSGNSIRSPDPIAVPQDEWFQLQFYWRRASEPSGEVALYLNGALVSSRSDIITDDSGWGQWYVGNLAQMLTPVDSELYVDDVTISPSLDTAH
jgi:hypothetical protein